MQLTKGAIKSVRSYTFTPSKNKAAAAEWIRKKAGRKTNTGDVAEEGKKDDKNMGLGKMRAFLVTAAHKVRDRGKERLKKIKGKANFFKKENKKAKKSYSKLLENDEKERNLCRRFVNSTSVLISALRVLVRDSKESGQLHLYSVGPKLRAQSNLCIKWNVWNNISLLVVILLQNGYRIWDIECKERFSILFFMLLINSTTFGLATVVYIKTADYEETPHMRKIFVIFFLRLFFQFVANLHGVVEVYTAWYDRNFIGAESCLTEQPMVFYLSIFMLTTTSLETIYAFILVLAVIPTMLKQKLRYNSIDTRPAKV